MKKKRIFSLFLCFLLIGGMLMHSLNYAVAEETKSSGSTLEESSDEGVVGSSEDAVSSNYEEDSQQEETLIFSIFVPFRHP